MPRAATSVLILALAAALLGPVAARAADPAGGAAAAPPADAATTPAGSPAAPAAAPAPQAPPALVADPLGPIPADDPKTEAYAHGGYALAIGGEIFGLLVLYLLLATGLSAGMQSAAERVVRRPWLVVMIYVALYALVRFVVDFPLSVYSGFVREKTYGFMNQTFGGWMGDEIKGLAVSIVVLVLFVPILYSVIRRLGGRWWIPGAAITVAFVVLIQVVAPVLIAPIFNKFTPLQDAALRRDILDMAHAQGIPADEVYQVDASRQSSHSNAYVAGILGTQRVVLYDTVLTRYTPREIRFVMAHEMGHYVLHHIWKTVAFTALVIVVGFIVVDRLARRLLAARPAWGVAGLEQPASLPAIFLVLGLFTVVIQPGIATFSRHQEHAADAFGLDVVRDPEAAASVFRKFGIYDLSELQVNPVIEFCLFSHPSTGKRIEFAQRWARQHPGVKSPAETGVPLNRGGSAPAATGG